MRVRSAFLGLCVVAATAVPALPAHAAPYKDPFDGSGKLARVVCPESAITYGGIPRTREYLATVVKCLDKSWKAHFAADRRPFRKPAVRFYDEPERRVCGVPWPESAAAFYCTNRRVLVFPLTGDWIENRTDLYPLKVAAHEYGHHLQSLTGARRHYEAGVKASPGRQAELGRRYELQADCLSGVFLGAVWGVAGAYRRRLGGAARRHPRQRRRRAPAQPRRGRHPGALAQARPSRRLPLRLRHLVRPALGSVLTWRAARRRVCRRAASRGHG
ncbi:neutral zinc metallopeptidase [Nonomuraea ferruginea]